MQRRQFLVAGGSGCLASLGGCTAVDLPGVGADGHPFADSTVTVRVDDKGSTAHDVTANATEVLDFWAAESSQHVDFEVDFEIVTDEQPDIVLAYVDSSEDCSGVENYSSDVLGCAPLVRPKNRISRPVTAHVVAADRPFGSVRTTAKHEIGHILGLDHDDEPQEIMSNQPEDRIPLYAVRIDIWETVVDGREQADAASQRFSKGINTWNDEQYDKAVDALGEAQEGFEAVREAYSAARDRTVDLEAEPPLETVNLSSLQTDLDRLGARMEAIGDVASTMAEASEAADDGEGSTARRLSAEANDGLAEFHEMDSPETRDIAVALGLVRGYNHEESDVTLGDGGL